MAVVHPRRLFPPCPSIPSVTAGEGQAAAAATAEDWLRCSLLHLGASQGAKADQLGPVVHTKISIPRFAGWKLRGFVVFLLIHQSPGSWEDWTPELLQVKNSKSNIFLVVFLYSN